MNFLLQEVVFRQYTVHLCHLFQLCQPLGANCYCKCSCQCRKAWYKKKRQDEKTEAIKQENLPPSFRVFLHTKPPHELSFGGFTQRSYTWAMKCSIVEGYRLISTTWGTFEVHRNLIHTVFLFAIQRKKSRGNLETTLRHCSAMKHFHRLATAASPTL